MFHTGYVLLEEEFSCDYDCEITGCPKHRLTLEINNTAGIAHLKQDDKEILVLDCGQAEALYKMLDFLVKN